MWHINELQWSHDRVALDLGKQLRTIINDAQRGFSGETMDLVVSPFVPRVQYSLQEQGNEMFSEGKDGLEIDRA